MKNRRWIPIALTLGMMPVACDSGTGPETGVETLTIAAAGGTMIAGETMQLTLRLTDSKGNTATIQGDNWASSDPFVASVAPDGLVTAHCGGVTTITATAQEMVAQLDLIVGVPGEAAPSEVYLNWSPRVLDTSSPGPLMLTVHTPASTPTPLVELAGTSGLSPMCRVGVHSYQVPLDPARTLSGYSEGDLHQFVGYLHLGEGGDFRGNLFINVKDATVPEVLPSALSATAQHTGRVFNLQHEELLLGGALPPDVIQSFYQRFPDDHDFIAVVEQVESFNNRSYRSVRNDTHGVGLPIFDHGTPYDSPARLQGIISFPISTFFDLGETAASHEIGHRWINFLDYPPTAQGSPHWPISNLARGLMGFNIPGTNVGGQFPFVLTEQADGSYLLTCEGAGKEYNDLDLYLMGLLPPDSVGENFVFSNQDQASALTCGGTLQGPVHRFGAAEVIAVDGPRLPGWPETQKEFSIATIVLSAGRLLTASEMAFFHHMAARGSATEELRFTSGFASGMTKPFHLATGGRGTLKTLIGAAK